MKECIYKDLRYKILVACDGFQVWERVSSKWDIWGYIDTFKNYFSAILFIEDIKMRKING